MKQRFEALDAFRGLCALFVVVFHMRLVGSITELDFFRGSATFVEFFFVLSGFVLAHGYGFKENLNFVTFMKSRFFRVYPLHFFMLVVFIALELGKLFAYKYSGLKFGDEAFTTSTAIVELVPNLLLIQSWTPFTNPLSFNYPAWSISIEFYMYALLFLSIVSFKSYKIVSWFFISLIAFCLIYLESSVLVSTVLAGLSCFFGGSFTYVIYKKISHLKQSYTLGTFIEVTLLVCIVLIIQSKIEYRSIIAPVLFMLTVLFFAFESGLVSKLFKVKVLQYAGKLSYSIYMIHAAIILCLTSIAMILQKVMGIKITSTIRNIEFLDFGSSIINNLVVVLILALVIGLSKLTYNHIELKGQQLNKKRA